MPHTFFEGPEKKVELAVVEGHPSLRELGGDFWRGVARAAKAEVLSVISNGHLDAYLLSESSLFVYDTFVTMITCGQTTLVDAVDAMLERIPPKAISVLIYERKNEHFPHLQETSFFEDARRLRAMVPGRALRFGVEHEHAVRLFHTTCEHEPEPDDRTLEVLMHGIDPALAARFRRADRPESFSDVLRLDRALEGFELDEYFFEPAGYSLNGLRGPHYVTLHVTPERVGSYVSFETNADFAHDPSGLVQEVVACFGPESFDVVVFEPDAGPVRVEVPGYVQRNRVHEPLSGYHVTFQHFYRPSLAPSRAFELPLE